MPIAPIVAACLRINSHDGLITPQDIVECLEHILDKMDFNSSILGVAYTVSDKGDDRQCRGFVWRKGHLTTTALVDPRLPGSRTHKLFYDLSHYAVSGEVDKAFTALSSTPLHRQFHEKVSAWFKSLPKRSNNELRHLIRIMFAQLLQERGLIPDEALWGWTPPTREGEVHHHIVWLFEQLLATPKSERRSNSDDWRQSLINEVPFLNGSLFTPLDESEKPIPLNNHFYLNDETGLLSILGQYDWTLSDQTSLTSESAIDPSMLGEMFERLILETEGALLEGDKVVHKKMPAGTYYTPLDVAEEMVSDAIASWLSSKLSDISWEELRALAQPAPQNKVWENWSEDTRKEAWVFLNEVRYLDPCCGSGAFTMTMLFGLSRALSRLKLNKPLEDIIENQLYAVDINPIAVLITRLRLFIALVDDRISSDAKDKLRPLPNLETRCITADTLSINLVQQQVLGAEEWDTQIAELRSARELWTRANHKDEKEYALCADHASRNQLKEIGKGLGKSVKDLKWLNWDFLSASALPAKHDIRDLFPAPKGGWDIVIGNPPYQKPDKEDKKRGKQLGYKGFSSNLYLMFIEAAIAVTREAGCVVLIVPHSIVFRITPKSFNMVRQTIQSQFYRVNVRTYDNAPRPTFPPLPWLKGKGSDQNYQRVTILIMQSKHAVNPMGMGRIYSQGLLRLNSENRADALGSVTKGQIQLATISTRGQSFWTQAPTPELSDLLLHMVAPNPLHKKTKPGKQISIPSSSRYFLTCLPTEILRFKKTLHLPDNEFYWPWIGLYNSHLFNAWWLMVGDAFHVNHWQYRQVRMPEGWHQESLRKKTEEMTRLLFSKEVLESCYIKPQGKAGPNYNFHKEGALAAEIIAELDALLLKAYDLSIEPLVSQMRTIRTGSAHELLG